MQSWMTPRLEYMRPMLPPMRNERHFVSTPMSAFGPFSRRNSCQNLKLSCSAWPSSGKETEASARRHADDLPCYRAHSGNPGYRTTELKRYYITASSLREEYFLDTSKRS